MKNSMKNGRHRLTAKAIGIAGRLIIASPMSYSTLAFCAAPRLLAAFATAQANCSRSLFGPTLPITIVSMSCQSCSKSARICVVALANSDGDSRPMKRSAAPVYSKSVRFVLFVVADMSEKATRCLHEY